MASLLYRTINPVVSRLLTSPLHGALSANTLLLHYHGRRSRRLYHTPVSYLQDGGRVHCFAGREHAWWRNLDAVEHVELTLRGRRYRGSVNVNPQGTDPELLRRFLLAVPRDARHSGVRLHRGEPVAEDLKAAAARLVHVTVTVTVTVGTLRSL